MSAKSRTAIKAKAHARDELLPSVDYPAPFEQPAEPELKVVSSAPANPLARAKASDPLHAVKALSEEEKIALFS